MSEELVRPGRECKKCGEDRRAEMVNHKQCVDGHTLRCKACKATTDRAYHETNRTKLVTQSRERYAANRDRYAAAQRSWRAANKERKAAADRAWYAANRERRAAAIRAWNEANRERRAATSRAWVEANKERWAEYQRMYRATNSAHRVEYTRAWAEANKDRARELSRASSRRRRSRKLDSPCASASLADVVEMCEAADEYLCTVCGGAAEHLDHILPLSRGGCDAVHNLQWLCAACNLSKSDRLMSEWLPGRLQQLAKELSE